MPVHVNDSSSLNDNRIPYIDRKSGEKRFEKVYHARAIALLYGSSWLARFFIHPLFSSFLTKLPWFSKVYGYLQRRPSSAAKILPFIKAFEVDSSEFSKPVEQFSSFNDFFIRTLKPEARRVALDYPALIPADGRYFFYANIDTCSGFIVKGKKFSLSALLKDSSLAQEYRGGSLVLARLCPSDYHRFHFPCDCIPGETKLLNGYLSSVNPIAVKNNIEIFTENKRTLCKLASSHFGQVLYIEVGATCVGTIEQTYTPGKKQNKGDEKGFFAFGGSSLILLFKKNTIVFSPDLLAATNEGIEIRCLMGQPMGILPEEKDHVLER